MAGKCKRCKGTGICHGCAGTGYLTNNKGIEDLVELGRRCFVCKGTGQCQACDGMGIDAYDYDYRKQDT